MIVGMYRADKDAKFPAENLIAALGKETNENNLVTSFDHSHLKVAFQRDNIASRMDMDGIFVSEDKKVMVSCEGNLFNAHELQKLLNLEKSSPARLSIWAVEPVTIQFGWPVKDLMLPVLTLVRMQLNMQKN